MTAHRAGGKKKIALIVAIATVAVLAAGALFATFNEKTSTHAATPSATASTSPSGPSVPKPTSNAAARAAIKAASTPAGFAKAAAAQFPTMTAKTTGSISYTKKEMQEAAYSAYLYAMAAVDTPYFLDGSFARNLKNSDGTIQAYFGRYFDADFYADIAGKARLLGTSKETKKIDGDLYAAFQFTGAKSDFTPCPQKLETTCNTAGYPKLGNGGNVTFGTTTKGGAGFIITVDSRISVSYHGKTGYIPVTTTFTLYEERNPNYTGAAGQLPFVLDGSSVHVQRGGFVQG